MSSDSTARERWAAWEESSGYKNDSGKAAASSAKAQAASKSGNHYTAAAAHGVAAEHHIAAAKSALKDGKGHPDSLTKASDHLNKAEVHTKASIEHGALAGGPKYSYEQTGGAGEIKGLRDKVAKKSKGSNPGMDAFSKSRS